MKISQKQDDFSKSKNVSLMHGCCCCCFFWAGGLIGAVIGSATTGSLWETAIADSKAAPYLRIARKFFWSTILVTVVFGLFCGLVLSQGGNSGGFASFFLSVILLPAPVLSFFIAAIVTALAIPSRIPDESIRRLVNKRNFGIVLGSLIGYGIGWAITVGSFN